MTILCPAELDSAVRFAEETDRKAEKLAMDGVSPDWKRGRAVATLMRCIADRAAAEASANANLRFMPGSVVEDDSECRKAADMHGSALPVVEVRIAADFAEHSFFFYEDWIDPMTRRQVHVLDPLWYVFDKPVAADVSRMSEEDLESAMFRGVCSPTFDETVAEKARAGGREVRKIMRRRRGLSGGLVCHADYDDGKPTGLCYWSTHT